MTKDEKRQWREFREWKQVHDYEKKTKKPPALRGSRRVHDKQTGEWSYAPRSGFASGFLQLFSLFLMIVVLWNVATGAGYSSYKTAVAFLYGATEAIGSVVRSVADGVSGAFDEVSGFKEMLERSETGRVEYRITAVGNLSGKILLSTCRKLSKGDLEVIVATGKPVDTGKMYKESFQYVVKSNSDDFSVGDVIEIRWFFGSTLVNKTTGKKVIFMKNTYAGAIDKYITGEYVG